MAHLDTAGTWYRTCLKGLLRACDDELAFARALRLVQRLVGEPKERLRVLAVCRARCEAEARRELREGGIAARRQLGKHGLDALHDDPGAVLLRLGEQQCEFVTADAESGVRAAQGTGEDAGERMPALLPMHRLPRAAQGEARRLLRLSLIHI